MAAHGGAQQPERLHRIGVLVGSAADDPDGQARLTGLLQGLERSGWIDGRNVRIDYRSGAGDAELMRRYAVELIALSPDVIVTTGIAPLAALQQATQVVPIVFAAVT